MFELSLKAYQNVNLNIFCQPYMERLVDQFNESVGLYHYAKINGHTQALCTSYLDSTLPVKVSFSLGKWTPLCCTAYGKMYLSCLTGDALTDAITNDQCPSNLMPSLDKLEQQISLARQNSYIIEYEEYEDGVVNIAVPITKYTGRIIASLCVALPVQRATKEHINAIVTKMKQMSKELSAIPL